ncbi:MAG: arginine--tRNA ligase [Candidatus Daviesbacteria bacterium]|nr:MAG: arginine--tRNA ligase [Candidatus Daviesbacteria bacterium]
MLKQKLLEDLQKTVEDLGYPSTDILLSISKNPEFGDYTTNIALQLANLEIGKLHHSPVEIANEIKNALEKLVIGDKERNYLEKVEVAGPGFINFYLKTAALIKNLPLVCNYTAMVDPQIKVAGEKRKILVEYASFNALKPVHVGHLRNIVLGESLVRLLKSTNNEVFKVTYTSDIGLPTAKTIWAVQQLKKQYQQAQKAALSEKADFLGQAYAFGSEKYNEDEVVKKEINELNKKIYARDKEISKLWQEILGWSFDYFNYIYELVGTKFDKEFLESEVEGEGKEIVLKNIDKVFKEDQGAVIFRGEEHDLHNRVFVTSAGNPTYEAKEMALAKQEYKAFPFDLAIHVVANEQLEYFKVVFKALSLLDKNLAKKERHLSYGYVTLSSGRMSSRKGNVIILEYIYDKVRRAVEEIMKKSATVKDISENERQQIINMVSLGAIKFSLLKYSPKTDVVFDLKKSVSLTGDSGPYVQYSYARAKSVLRTAHYDYEAKKSGQPKKVGKMALELEERMILRRIEQFPQLVKEASDSFAPQTVANFLLSLAKEFNLFYQKHPIIKAKDSGEFRLALTCAVAVVLKQGLYLLGIEAPERM